MRTRSPMDRLLGLPAKTNRNITVHANLPVTMRDGVVLYADRYVPVGDDDAPLVLMRTPYGRKHLWTRLYCRPFAQRGYQVVIQSCRGTEDSGGQLVPFDERDDGLDTVAWLREQPWYPGRFAAFGPSYWGLAQWALADGAADDLAAIIAVLTSSRLARSLSFGGAFSLEGWLTWSAVIAAQADRRPGLAALLRTRSRRVARALWHLPLGDVDRVAVGRTLDWWQEWLAHPDPDDGYWQRLDWSAAVEKVDVPVMMVASWHDLFAPWQLADWAELPPAAPPRRLVVAPWVHQDSRLFRLYMREALTWLDAHMRGNTGGGGGAGGGGGYDPTDPTPAVGGPSARRYPRVRQDDVEKRADVLTFTTSELADPVDVVGTGRARVHLRSSVAHTDVVVRLCDVDPKCRSVNVCHGIRRVTPSQVEADADGVRAVDVDLWPTGHRFARGHRIRVQVASAAFPLFDRNPGTGEAPVTATRLVAADQEVFHDPAHPSHVSLPTVHAT